MDELKKRLTKKQLFRIITGAIKQVRNEHEYLDDSSLTKRLVGSIYGFIFNNDGVENGEPKNKNSSSPSLGEVENGELIENGLSSSPKKVPKTHEVRT